MAGGEQGSEQGGERGGLRERILKVSRRLFVEHGYEATSMRLIAREVGCSSTAIYLYFKNKDALMFAVIDDGFEQFTQKLHEAGTFGGSPVSRLRRLGWAYVEFGLEHVELYSMIFLQRSEFLIRSGEEGDDAKPAETGEPRYKALHVLRRVLTEIVGKPEEHQDVVAHADALWAGLHGIVSLTITTPIVDRARAMRASELVIELFISGLSGK